MIGNKRFTNTMFIGLIQDRGMDTGVAQVLVGS